ERRIVRLREQLDEPLPGLQQVRAAADEREQPLDRLVGETVLREHLRLDDEGLDLLGVLQGRRRNRRRGRRRWRRGRGGRGAGRRGLPTPGDGVWRRGRGGLVGFDRGHLGLRCVNGGRVFEVEDELLVLGWSLGGRRRRGGRLRRRPDVLEALGGLDVGGIGLLRAAIVV